jgi:glycosyltransferase involved in cell wall biosynthesis
MHTDGLGWQRTKWSRSQRAYYRWSERVCAAVSTALVTDSRVMGQYYQDQYGASSSFIPYGHGTGAPGGEADLAGFGVKPREYFLAVARMEPENNLDWIISELKRSRCRLPLLVVGGSRYDSEYAKRTMAMADERVRCLGNVWDARVLNSLYANCYVYVHGHEVGGTNPGLLRAMGARAACLPIDVSFHREVLGDQEEYFAKRPGDLAGRLERLENEESRVAEMAERAFARATSRYRWDAVAAAYAELFEAVIAANRAHTPFRSLGFEPYRPAEFAGA